MWDHLRQDPSLFQQRQSQRPGRAASQDRAPSPQPRAAGPGADSWRLMSDPRLRGLPQEGLTLVRPATSHLTTEDHQQGASVGSRELEVASFRRLARARAAPSTRTEVQVFHHPRGDHRCIDGEPRAMEQRQPIHDHFKSVHSPTRWQVPASLHTRAAALSNAKPRTPETARADRWWSKVSSGRPHPQADEDRGRGRQRRWRSNTRKNVRVETGQ